MIKLTSCTLIKDGHFTLAIDNLMIEKGKKYFVIGASGSGKSTLLHVLTGLAKFSGVLRKNGTIVSNVSSYKKGLMYLSQEYALWNHMSVSAHINFTLSQGKKTTMQEETAYYLARLNLANKSNNKPHELSGGEKQKLALARALAAKPEYLFLDEPFANIDIVQANTLMTIIEEEQRKEGFTLVKVSHNIIGIKDKDSIIIVMEKGRIIFQGTYSEMVQQNISPWVEKWKELLV